MSGYIIKIGNDIIGKIYVDKVELDHENYYCWKNREVIAVIHEKFVQIQKDPYDK